MSDRYPHDSTGKEVCKESRISLHTGMYSLTVTLFSFVLGLILIVLKNSGEMWATASLASGVIIGGALTGGALGLLAVVFGIIAIHKINQYKELYTGKKKAVTGIVFASILIGILTLVVT